MALIPLSPAQRRDALEKAVAARVARAEAKALLRSGEATVGEVLERAQTDEALARLKVTDMLESLHGVGPVRALAILEGLGIAPSRRLRGLGAHQRRALVDFLGAN
ncbi:MULTISPECIES: integration host factor, actinobacterial type [Sinomonas]|uniref:Integration host factor, actinobacterial type n=1 Tax=Sinomonas flava TaxID=496857 RepID=A0ABN3BKP4_9MICC|nr:integration host factor, actinobacterial type [Sinomonas sp. R1AF57]ASN52053.1 DNA-binding protein [Sinomonas sp. R1AF57]